MSKKLWIRIPENTKMMLPEIEELATLGLNKVQICTNLKIDRNSFSKYQDCYKAFEMGRSKLAKKVAQSFSENITESYSDRVHLSKSLRLFSGSYHLEPITDIETAQKALASSIKAFASGTISIEDLEAIRKSTSTFVDSVVSTDLENRLITVEKELSDKRGVSYG